MRVVVSRAVVVEPRGDIELFAVEEVRHPGRVTAVDFVDPELAGGEVLDMRDEVLDVVGHEVRAAEMIVVVVERRRVGPDVLAFHFAGDASVAHEHVAREERAVAQRQVATEARRLVEAGGVGRLERNGRRALRYLHADLALTGTVVKGARHLHAVQGHSSDAVFFVPGDRPIGDALIEPAALVAVGVEADGAGVRRRVAHEELVDFGRRVRPRAAVGVRRRVALPPDVVKLVPPAGAVRHLHVIGLRLLRDVADAVVEERQAVLLALLGALLVNAVGGLQLGRWFAQSQ